MTFNKKGLKESKHEWERADISELLTPEKLREGIKSFLMDRYIREGAWKEADDATDQIFKLLTGWKSPKEVEEAIKQERERISGMLNRAEGICLNAVNYVGAANYAEREQEAESKVEQAFEELQQALKDKP